MIVKVRAINAIKSDIANDLIVDYVIDHLIEVNVFTEDEKRLILASGQEIGSRDDLSSRNQVLRRQCEHFLELLVQKMTEYDFAFNHFILALFMDANYPWIGHKLQKLVDEMKSLDELMVIPGPSRGRAHRSPTPSQEATNGLPNATPTVITLQDIKGYDSQINQLKDLIETPFRKGSKLKHKSVSWPKTALIYGPMGTGKTSVCNALCSEFSQKMFCMYVNCGTILTKKIDRSKENLISLFGNCVQKSPSLVVLDNCEIICSKTDNGLVSVLGSLLNDLPKNKHVVVILVTNKLELIDDSLRRSGRIDREITFPLPQLKERFEILNKFLNEDICDFDSSQLKMFAKRRDIKGFSGADLELVCRESNWSAAKSDRKKITLQDLEVGLEWVVTTTKRRHSVTVTSEESPPRRPLTFVRSLSATEWPQPNPIAFERLNYTPTDDGHRLALFGPPGSYRSLIAEAESAQSSINFLSLDLSPENSNDCFDCGLPSKETLGIPFIDE